MNVDELKQRLIEGDAPGTAALTKEALDEGLPAQKVLNEVLIPAMGVVGELFEKNEYFVPELLLAARAMYGALDLLRPKLTEGDYKPTGKAVVGTVQGDLHDIGKKLVMIMLEGNGFQVVDLGTDVAPEKFLEAVKESGSKLVGLSALLTTTLPAMEKTVRALKEVDSVSQGDDRRRAGHPGLRRQHRRRRLRPRRQCRRRSRASTARECLTRKNRSPFT